MPESNNPSLPSLLRKLRGRESLRHASNRIGISHNYLNNLEKGIDPRSGKEIRPSPDILKKISTVYDCSYETLMRASGYTHHKNTIGEVKDLKDLLRNSTELKWGENIISRNNRRKILTILEALLDDS